MKRIYVSEEAYRALVEHLLATRGTTRGISELASRLILEALGEVAERDAEVEPDPTDTAQDAPGSSQPQPLTDKQLRHILDLLGRNRWNWLDVKDVLEWEVGAPLPDDPADLTKREASRVIGVLRRWEEKPSPKEVSEARKLLKRIPEGYARQLNLPESTSQVRRYHLSLIRYALRKLKSDAQGAGQPQR